MNHEIHERSEKNIFKNYVLQDAIFEVSKIMGSVFNRIIL